MYGDKSLVLGIQDQQRVQSFTHSQGPVASKLVIRFELTIAEDAHCKCVVHGVPPLELEELEEVH